MSYDTICSISRFYNVSVDYLLGISAYKKNYNLSSDEQELLKLYRNSDARGKKIIIEVAKISNI